MSIERWQQLDRIFAEARGIPAAGRAAFVARACAADHALGTEALALLAADEASGEFMAQPAMDRLAQKFASDKSSLRPGERIGAYTILGLLGSGGVGEVWRARDERLSRDVAIKVLLPHLNTDTERLRRFAEEARTAGALNHSNILIVHDVGEHEGVPFLVSECLEGTNLRARLEARPIGVDEAVTIALAVARGLAAAHARGIVHRDLKPENVFLGSDGSVKVLDFGLAKLQRPVTSLAAGDNETMTGAIVGTAAYMAPEQVRGEPADVRTDLFAVGVMLYEMLARQHPFRGASTFATLQAVLTADPTDLVNRGVPEPLARIVMRLLQKAPAARFQSAIDCIWALEQASTRADRSTSATSRRHRWIPWIAALALASAAIGAATWRWLDRRPDVRPVETARFTWSLPAGVSLDSAPAVSPSGRHIAFAGRDATGSRLFVRELGALDTRGIPGSEGARQPFWSPDGDSIGFFAGGRLKKVTWPKGAPVEIAAAAESRGGAWGSTGAMVFAPDVILSGLSRVGADGGAVEPATQLEVSKGDTSHWWPVFLPDGVHFLYFVRSNDDARRGIYVGRIDGSLTQAGTPLFRSDSDVAFAPLPGTEEGALFYVVDGRVEVRRFDVERRSVDADARTIGLAAGGGTLYHPAMLSASSDVLAFADANVPNGNRLEAVARSGERIRLWDEVESQHWPRISPDGRRLARLRVDPLRNNPDIWVDDIERDTRVRVTTAPGPDIQPVWSPDGEHLAYVSGNLPGREGEDRIISIAAADGTGVVQSFRCPGEYCEPTDWSRDGRHLLVNVLGANGADVWTIALDEAGAARPLLNEKFTERDARFSPDGRWVAYVAEESGRPEVSVRTLSGRPRRVVVSAEGGAQPVWRRDGQELFFVDPQGRLRSVAVSWTKEGVPAFASSAELKVPPIGFGHWGTQYDVAPDGSRIYFLPRNDDPAPREIHVIIGWRALLD